jgi:hypothetical protein
MKTISSISFFFLCLFLRKIEPQSEVSVGLRCLAFEEGLYRLQDIKLYDRISKKFYRVEVPFEVLVVD